MKKFFLLLSVAFISAGMIACGDDKEEGDNPQPHGGNTYTINMGNGTTWVANSVDAIDYTEENYITLYGYKTAEGQEGAYVFGWLESVPGSYDYASTDGDCMNYRDPDDIFEYGGSYYYNFIGDDENFTETITAIDLTALTIDGNWNQPWCTCQEYVDNDFEMPTNLKNMTGVMDALGWNEWSVPNAKANTAKTKKVNMMTLAK